MLSLIETSRERKDDAESQPADAVCIRRPFSFQERVLVIYDLRTWMEGLGKMDM